MKIYQNLTKAELIKCIKRLEKGAQHDIVAFEHQRLLHDLQVHQVELETQNRELRETHQLLEVSRDKYADLYDYAPVGYVTLDQKGSIREINLTAASMLGVERSRLIGLPFSRHVVKGDLPAYHEHLRKLTRPDDRATAGLGLTVKGGGLIQVEMQSLLVLDAGRKVRLIRSTLTDITLRKAAEAALRHSEANLARAQQIAHVGSYEFEPLGTKQPHWSAEIFRILGLDPSQKTMSRDEYVARFVHPDDQARVRENIERTLNEAARYDVEYRLVRSDGSICHVHSVAEPVMGPEKKVMKVVGFLQDITARKELEKEILRISEREQSRIGQDLHDGLCQHLAGIEFRLLSLKQELAGEANKHAAETIELSKLIRQAMEQTRTLAHGLSPVMLESGGLMNALGELAINTEKMFAITCSVNCPVAVLIHDHAVATHLFRITQEAIQNAIRHGKANSVVINLLTARDRIILHVKDNGVGFPREPRTHKGMGLRIMQYRAGMIGGSIVVQRDPDRGMSVICECEVKQGLKVKPASEPLTWGKET